MAHVVICTNNGPVKIDSDLWPVIAEGEGDSWNAQPDPARHAQARRNRELDIYLLRVRENADGRVLVYGILDGARAWTGIESWAGGELLNRPSREELIDVIKRVGLSGGLPARIIRECIADLPPMPID